MGKNIEEIAKKIFDLEEGFISRSGGEHRLSLGSVVDRSDLPDQLVTDFGSLAKYIDHTVLKPETSLKQIEKLCQEAEEFGFASVCVNPVWATEAEKVLKTVPLCCVVGFPLGANIAEVKMVETIKALEAGAKEIDMVINVGALKGKNYSLLEDEIALLALDCHKSNAKLKVIIEACLLTEEEKIVACLLSKKAGADFVKTSTGFSTGGATVEDIALMRAVVGPKMGVKASGGIRDKETALAMLKAGANRIGASAGISICS